jgi:hypothetical protein
VLLSLARLLALVLVVKVLLFLRLFLPPTPLRVAITPAHRLLQAMLLSEQMLLLLAPVLLLPMKTEVMTTLLPQLLRLLQWLRVPLLQLMLLL